MWWPEETEPIQNIFDHLGKELFKPLRGCGHPVFEGASLNIYRQMDRFKGVNSTDEHFDLTTTNHKQMISLVLMAENCSEFFGCLAEIASFYLEGSGRALPEITPTRKWSSGKRGTWRIGPSSLAWDANLGFSLPIVFFGRGAGCSEIQRRSLNLLLLFLRRSGATRTMTSGAAGVLRETKPIASFPLRRSFAGRRALLDLWKAVTPSRRSRNHTAAGDR